LKRVENVGFQFQFAAEVYKKVKENGHEIVGVFTIPDSNNREDPVAAVAR
jgi:formyltetrahydrofolate dehydrogenase